MSAATAHLALVPDVGAGDEDGGLGPLQQWELYMRGAGRSPRTIAETLRITACLELYSDRRIECVRAIDIARFLGRSHLTQNSRASYYGSLRAFYRWWGNNGGVDVMVKLPRPRVPRGVPRPVTDRQVEALLSVRMHRRTRVMILLAAFAGLRVHEIAKVRGEDVDTDARTLRVKGKGGHTAVLPLHPLLIEAARGMPRRGWWFPGNSCRPDQPVMRRSVSQIISQAMDRAGIPGGTAHRLRHWYGTKLVGQGTDLRTTQILMRHAHLNTTAIYVQIADPNRAAAIERLSTDPDE